MAEGREGGIGGLVGGIFMRGNKSTFLRQSTLYSLLYIYTYTNIYIRGVNVNALTHVIDLNILIC